jgi:hypothetical protein
LHKCVVFLILFFLAFIIFKDRTFGFYFQLKKRSRNFRELFTLKMCICINLCLSDWVIGLSGCTAKLGNPFTSSYFPFSLPYSPENSEVTKTASDSISSFRSAPSSESNSTQQLLEEEDDDLTVDSYEREPLIAAQQQIENETNQRFGSVTRNMSAYYEITEVIEMGKMAGMFFNKTGTKQKTTYVFLTSAGNKLLWPFSGERVAVWMCG